MLFKKRHQREVAAILEREAALRELLASDAELWWGEHDPDHPDHRV